MSVPTRTLRFDIKEADDQPIVGATVKARLTAYDIYQNQVVDRVDELTTTDAAGHAELNIFPNVLGERGTAYKVEVRHPTTNRVILKTVIFMPDVDSDITDLIGNAGEGISQSGAENLIQSLVAPGLVAKIGVDLYALRTIVGTTNQVNVANGNGQAGNPTLSLPQNIHAAATPTFAGLTLTAPGSLTLSAIAAAAVIFAGSGGILSGDATNFKWDNATKQLLLGNGTAAAPAYSFAANTNRGMFNDAANLCLAMADGGVALAGLKSDAARGLELVANIPLSWLDTTALSGFPDVRLYRDGVGALAQRVGTATQQFRIYNTFTDASNYERASIRFTGGGAMEVAHSFAGTGLTRAIRIITDGDSAVSLAPNGSDRWIADVSTSAYAFRPTTDNSQDLGTSTTRRLRTGYFATSVFTPIVDSGGVGDLQVKVNNAVSFAVGAQGSPTTNYIRMFAVGTGGAPAVQAFGGDTNIALTVTSKGTGQISFQTNNFSQEQLRVAHTASAVNYVHITGAATAGPPVISAQGADANVGFDIVAKGTGDLRLGVNGFLGAFRVFGGTASMVNGVQLTPAIATGAPTLTSYGSDTNIDLNLSSKGTGGINLCTTTSNVKQLGVGHTANAVNYVEVFGAATAAQPQVRFSGSDTNVGGIFYTKGTGGYTFYTNVAAAVPQFVVAHTASAVNYVQVTGAPTGSSALVRSAGSDTNVGLLLSSQGTGTVSVQTGGTARTVAQFLDAASSVNFLQFSGAATSVYPYIQATGSDTNVEFGYATKGTGMHRFFTNGTAPQLQILHTAGATRCVTITGSNAGNPTLSVTAGDLAITPNVAVAGLVGVGAAGVSTTTALNTPAGTTGVSSLRLAHGVAPTSPVNGDVWTTTSGVFARVNGATVGPFAAASGTGAAQKELCLAASDETTALTTGTSKMTFRMPYAMTLTGIRASLSTAQTSGSIFTVDVNEAGTTIISTKITIDNTEKTSTTAATPPVISDTTLADDAEITIDIDQVGDGTAKGLKVYLIGRAT